ncbi:MAG: aminoglycoside phosphotransferase family protein [Clostridiales bacterium]|nr:aminoglycoside phosphotransferase family protein [Clostridiales bacterium]
MGENRGFSVEEISKNFQFKGEFQRCEPNLLGHINDTYAVCYSEGSGRNHKYILQRINHDVFKEPIKLMENISGVTRHMREKIIRAGGDPMRETLNLIPTIDGGNLFISEDGDHWRAYHLVCGARSYQQVEKPEHFYEAGKAFGKFQGLLSDYPAENLHETIPNFHDTRMRFDALVEAVETDPLNRAKDVKEEIEFVYKRVDDTPILTDLLKKGDLPLRVTHNDTKFNNVLIDDKTGKGICVVDLDTVMPGLSLYDFGDSIRFGASTAEEDEQDLSKVWMDMGLYKAFTRGYLEMAGDSLTKLELEYMPFSAKLMTLECGMRFLGDHINGDTYFRIHRPGQNLDRAHTQFKLVADMETKLEEMAKVVAKI